MSTGSEAFSLFICLDANKFVLLSFFSLIKTIYDRLRSMAVLSGALLSGEAASKIKTACPDSWPFQLPPPSTHFEILLTTCLVFRCSRPNILSRFLSPPPPDRPPILLSAPNQNRHAEQARFTREFEPNHCPMMQKVHLWLLTPLAQKRCCLSVLMPVKRTYSLWKLRNYMWTTKANKYDYQALFQTLQTTLLLKINFEKLLGLQVFKNHNCNEFESFSSLSIRSSFCFVLFLLSIGTYFNNFAIWRDSVFRVLSSRFWLQIWKKGIEICDFSVLNFILFIFLKFEPFKIFI